MSGQGSQAPVALVTGANSGLGFEAAAQLAGAGYRQVILACRSLDQARAAAVALRARSGRDVFLPLEMDLCSLSSVRAAAEQLRGAGDQVSALVLNAGVLPGAQLIRTADGIEQTSAASLVGHHVFTLRLLRFGVLTQGARIVIAGSEGARGDAPGMKPTDLKTFAKQHCADDLPSAVRTLLTMQHPARHHWSTTYCTAKVLVALWARALASRLPSGMRVSAVSPGNVPATRAGRHQPWWFRCMLYLVSVLGPRIGLAAPVALGAKRYLDVLSLRTLASGSFYASPPGKLVGPLTLQQVPHLTDASCAAACWHALQALTREGEAEVASEVNGAPAAASGA